MEDKVIRSGLVALEFTDVDGVCLQLAVFGLKPVVIYEIYTVKFLELLEENFLLGLLGREMGLDLEQEVGVPRGLDNLEFADGLDPFDGGLQLFGTLEIKGQELTAFRG